MGTSDGIMVIVDSLRFHKLRNFVSVDWRFIISKRSEWRKESDRIWVLWKLSNSLFEKGESAIVTWPIFFLICHIREEIILIHVPFLMSVSSICFDSFHIVTDSAIIYVNFLIITHWIYYLVHQVIAFLSLRMWKVVAIHQEHWRCIEFTCLSSCIIPD